MKVVIEDLTFDCIIGILDFERITPQKVIIDISFKYTYNDSSSFIDYSKVAKDIENIMIKERFKLLEDAIHFIDKYLNNKYKIKKVKLKISKPNILTNCIVSLKNT